MLPVTPAVMRGPGYWGSPFARPRTIDMRHHPHGFIVPKGVWIIRCGGGNTVSMFWREGDDFSDEPRRAPGTGLIRRPPKPWPRPPGWGSNRNQRAELIGHGRSGPVFADGHSVLICGFGEAILIRVFR